MSKKNLKYPVFKVTRKGNKKPDIYAVVVPRIEIREGIPRTTKDGKKADDFTPKKGVFTAEQVAKDKEVAAHLVRIGSGAIRKIESEAEIEEHLDAQEEMQAKFDALQEKFEKTADEYEKVVEENNTLKKRIEELEAEADPGPVKSDDANPKKGGK